MLPGLGQLYQGSHLLACGLFSIFIALSLFPGTRLIVPLVAFAASWEAFRRNNLSGGGAKVETPSHPGLRTFAFAAVGMIGFLAWMGWVSPAFLPVGTQMDINDQVDRLAAEIRACRKAQGSYPRTLEDCLSSRKSNVSPIDPWGSPYVYTLLPDGFELRSPGRDRKLGTEDDYIYRLH